MSDGIKTKQNKTSKQQQKNKNLLFHIDKRHALNTKAQINFKEKKELQSI